MLPVAKIVFVFLGSNVSEFPRNWNASKFYPILIYNKPIWVNNSGFSGDDSIAYKYTSIAFR